MSADTEVQSQLTAARLPPGRLAANFIAFYICWFACVLGAARGYPWLGPLMVAIWLPLHLSFVSHPRTELIYLAVAGVLGYLADSILVLAGVLDFTGRDLLIGPAPLWMVALWISFATALNGSLAWLQRRYLLAAMFGLVGGPAAYLAGQSLGAVDMKSNAQTGLFAIGVVWMIAMLVLLGILSALQRTHRKD